MPVALRISEKFCGPSESSALAGIPLQNHCPAELLGLAFYICS